MVPQITIRLSMTSKVKFDQYAENLGLEASALAKLLITRERHQRRLAKLKSGGNNLNAARTSLDGAATGTVTAHFSAIERVCEFDQYARKCGLSRNRASAWLLEMELREKWLENAVRAKADL